jgi:hypothetical protein
LLAIRADGAGPSFARTGAMEAIPYIISAAVVFAVIAYTMMRKRRAHE